MDFKQIQKIKQNVEAYNNTAFYSILENNSLLVKNVNTDAIYKIAFNEDKEVITLDTTAAEKVVEGKKIEKNSVNQFKENCERVANGIKGIFSEDFETAIDNLRSIIHEIPAVDESAIVEDIKAMEQKEEEEATSWINKVFCEKMNKYQEEEKEFKKLFNLFDENDEIVKGQFVSLESIKQGLKEMSEAYEQYKEIALSFGDLKKQVKEVFETDELTDKFFEGFSMDKDPRVSVTKKLVQFNNELKTDFDIVGTTKKLVSIFENNPTAPIGGAKTPFTYNLSMDNKFTPKFFRFKMGIFSPEDIKTMLEEINFFVSSYDALEEESQLELYGMKMQLEYMYHSGDINDHLIMEMLKDFNAKYAKDKSDDYNNSAEQLAWKSRAQQKEGNAQGFAIGGATA